MEYADGTIRNVFPKQHGVIFLYHSEDLTPSGFTYHLPFFNMQTRKLLALMVNGNELTQSINISFLSKNKVRTKY